jgi:hypothetical protein
MTLREFNPNFEENRAARGFGDHTVGFIQVYHTSVMRSYPQWKGLQTVSVSVNNNGFQKTFFWNTLPDYCIWVAHEREL